MEFGVVHVVTAGMSAAVDSLNTISMSCSLISDVMAAISSAIFVLSSLFSLKTRKEKVERVQNPKVNVHRFEYSIGFNS